ncbi:hypothetical protein Arub01_57930 [Actinomadura rubrobrunea]|uniref:Uncharacterized protein n=1 Tax=Actinomadura rubrobrunea TaxID=115335 RepID=A0A9W6V082_9ACTN|nr:hypothetical protein Arub01_57930 [Actinomadura rubrobrunea]
MGHGSSPSRTPQPRVSLSPSCASSGTSPGSQPPYTADRPHPRMAACSNANLMAASPPADGGAAYAGPSMSRSSTRTPDAARSATPPSGMSSPLSLTIIEPPQSMSYGRRLVPGS